MGSTFGSAASYGYRSVRDAATYSAISDVGGIATGTGSTVSTSPAATGYAGR